MLYRHWTEVLDKHTVGCWKTQEVGDFPRSEVPQS